MAGTARDDSGGFIAGINVTPLVDIVLVLLIIFLVTAKLVVAPASALSMTLPRSATGEAVSSVFAISLAADGVLRVNGAAIADDAAFLQRARGEHQAHPELRAVIQADGATPHAKVVHLMDLLGQAGISQIAFAVTLDRSATPRP
jgi:biopolymer transport protein ExbD